jgi:mevalonate kinase
MDIFPSKLLLLGEYTIIQNSSALAIPYSNYRSHWSDVVFANPSQENVIDENFSKASLEQIFEDLKKLKLPKLHLSKMKKDLDNGLWVCSNSPIGYGLGSSGAVCAAIYDRYAVRKATDLEKLKKDLARLEHSFHGKSSGIDPLISYSNYPLWIHSNKKIESIKFSQTKENNKGAIFIVDTQRPRISTPLINYFVDRCKDTEFLSDFVGPVSAAVERAIPALIKQDYTTLLEAVALISELQFMYLPPMIPEEMQQLWMQGIESHDFYLKLCGAGGGGFLLGFTEDWEATLPYLEGYSFDLVSF